MHAWVQAVNNMSRELSTLRPAACGRARGVLQLLLPGVTSKAGSDDAAKKPARK